MNEIDGSSSVTTTVSGVGASMLAMAPKLDLRADFESSAKMRSMLNLTSSEVSALPEWKVTPGLSVNVYVRPSSLTV